MQDGEEPTEAQRSDLLDTFRNVLMRADSLGAESMVTVLVDFRYHSAL